MKSKRVWAAFVLLNGWVLSLCCLRSWLLAIFILISNQLCLVIFFEIDLYLRDQSHTLVCGIIWILSDLAEMSNRSVCTCYKTLFQYNRFKTWHAIFVCGLHPFKYSIFNWNHYCFCPTSSVLTTINDYSKHRLEQCTTIYEEEDGFMLSVKQYTIHINQTTYH